MQQRVQREQRVVAGELEELEGRDELGLARVRARVRVGVELGVGASVKVCRLGLGLGIGFHLNPNHHARQQRCHRERLAEEHLARVRVGVRVRSGLGLD